MNLETIRRQINRIDYEIVKLLNERMELTLRTKKLKSQVKDNQRERNVMENIKRFTQGLLQKTFTQKLFTDIMAESKRLQEQGLHLIGFQGEHGAFGEVAARIYDSNLVPIPCTKFVDVFEGVMNNHFDLGILPVENSLEGAVTEVNDLLIHHDLTVIGEVKVPIHHCLLTLKETDFREIKTVYSHPQALAQCRGFISRNRLEPRPFYDTAGAAKMISIEQPKATAVITSRLCAELYNLEIIKENIEDEASNLTRFLILSKEALKTEGDKCSIVFSTKHKAGALYSILEIFSEAGINLTRIESRPQKKDPGNYVFLLDFKGSNQDEKIQEALKTIRLKTDMYKFLGCYEEADK